MNYRNPNKMLDDLIDREELKEVIRNLNNEVKVYEKILEPYLFIENRVEQGMSKKELEKCFIKVGYSTLNYLKRIGEKGKYERNNK